VEVLVAEDEVALGARQLGECGERDVEEPSLERAPVALPPLCKRRGPARCDVGDPAERRTRIAGLPEAREERAHDRCRLVFAPLPQLRARLASLEQERVPLRVVREQTNARVVGPERERVRLMLGLLLGEVQLEDGGCAVAEANPQHEADVTLVRFLDGELPAFRALGDEAGQAFEPGGAVGRCAPPREALGDLQRVGTARRTSR
jgi:hypothetical protein